MVPVEDADLERRLTADPSERYKLYVKDVQTWWRQIIEFSLTGDGRFRFLPPSPRRVSKSYWRTRWITRHIGGDDSA